MKDSTRENLSYWGLYARLLRVKKEIKPQTVSFGNDKQQYFLYYEPKNITSDKVIVWVLSLGYRLSPKDQYPCQIEDVCNGYQSAIAFLHQKEIDPTKIVISGPSAGAHLTSILCYGKQVQETYGIDLTPVIGFIGVGGPYRFSEQDSLSVRLLLNQLFAKGYDRAQGEPCTLMMKSEIPMLLIQSKHDGLISYACAEEFYKKAKQLAIPCELYSVVDKKNTHSWYTAGMFLETRETNQGLDKFFTWIENL